MNDNKCHDIPIRLCNAVYKQNIIEKRRKSCILTLPKKGDLGINKNYKSRTIIAIAAKPYNDLNCIRPEIEKTLRKNQNSFRRNRSTTSKSIQWIIEGIRGTTIACKFLQGSWFHRVKMEHIFPAYVFSKETVNTIMMLNKNTKADGSNDFFSALWLESCKELY